jgi:antitoxin component YwqK of YwqJK toxin-antitoxin module
MRSYLFTLLFVAPVLGYSIESNGIAPYLLDDEEPMRATTGTIDVNGWKQGFFVLFGRDLPEKGYPNDVRVEEGEFKDNRKIGEWIVYHIDGVTPKLKGFFVDGRPNGPYEKFNAQGTMIEKSTFNNGKNLGDWTTYHDNGTVKQQKTFNAEGQEDGPSYVYYEDGTLQMQVNKVNGVKTGESKTYWPDGSVKNVVVYGDGGEVISTTVVNAEPPVKPVIEEGSGGPSGAGFKTKDGTKFNGEGYNKLYNKFDELEMDGEFKGGKLWDGKLYKYDSDGILLRIEIWKNGKYNSDGQL